ncbi:MAG: type II toxin-antitoxin system HicA family toxin [Thermoleophilia bacterium]|nr:type II toxin-antitoxin system HicA family toxin [Thermoleophilia bacterium]
MTALRELERHLIDHGCERVRHGARHDVWRSPNAERPVTVPRHREIPLGTARAICRQLGIPDPPR